jgi:hypothetical protein
VYEIGGNINGFGFSPFRKLVWKNYGLLICGNKLSVDFFGEALSHEQR